MAAWACAPGVNGPVEIGGTDPVRCKNSCFLHLAIERAISQNSARSRSEMEREKNDRKRNRCRLILSKGSPPLSVHTLSPDNSRTQIVPAAPVKLRHLCKSALDDMFTAVCTIAGQRSRPCKCPNFFCFLLDTSDTRCTMLLILIWEFLQEGVMKRCGYL